MVGLILSNAIIKNVSDFSIRLGQKFILDASAIEPKVEFFENNDAVLSIEQSANKATIRAAKVGSAQIQIQAPGIETIVINITVFTEEAVIGYGIENGTGLKSELDI
jgi:hypothetical protein